MSNIPAYPTIEGYSNYDIWVVENTFHQPDTDPYELASPSPATAYAQPGPRAACATIK